jgi:hypothetical protein
MPNSLMDMFQAQDLSGQPIGFGDALRQNSNAMVGLGMGLLQPRSLAHGAPVGSAWSDALQGYQTGSVVDQRRNVAQAQLQHQKRQEAFQRSQAAQHQANFERTFARGDVTDAQRAMRDVLGPNATPEQKADFMKSYYQPKTDPAWEIIQVPDPNDPDNKIPMWGNRRTQETKPLQPGQTGAAAPAADPFAAGAAPRPVYGQDGNFSTPAAPTAAAPTSSIPPAPPGADRKEWKKEQTKLEVQRRTAAEAAKRAGASIDPVTEDIDRAINQISQYPGMTTGGFSSVLKKIPIVGSATQAGEVESLINTVKANSSLEKLQQMRAQSPSGASGLGAVTQGEHKLLQDAIGSLDQSQDSASVLYNLERVKRIRHEIVHGPGTAPPPRYQPPEYQRSPGAAGAAAPAATTAPKPGTVSKGYVFKGGDPSDQNNWAPVK